MCVPGSWPSQNDLRDQLLPPEHSTPRCNFIMCLHPASYLYSTLSFIILAFAMTCPRKMLPLMWFLSLQDRCLRTYEWNLRSHAGNGKLNNFLSFVQPDSPVVWSGGGVNCNWKKRLDVKSWLPAGVIWAQPDDPAVGGNKWWLPAEDNGKVKHSIQLLSEVSLPGVVCQLETLELENDWKTVALLHKESKVRAYNTLISPQSKWVSCPLCWSGHTRSLSAQMKFQPRHCCDESWW